jgi:hypothetical protein
MRRIVLVDDGVYTQPLRFFGVGLGQEIYNLSRIKDEEESKQSALFTLGPGDAVMLCGPGAFEYLKGRYHFGIRGENYFDCSLLRRLSIEGGAFVKVIHESDFPGPEVVEDFMSPEFTEPRVFPGLQNIVIKTYQDSLQWLAWFLDLPAGTQIGFDYETSGMPMEIQFMITGASFACLGNAVFFSFQYIRETCTDAEWEDFRLRFRAIIEKHQRGLWTYNMQFEQQVTWREFGLDSELADASVYNVLDGLHSKNYSLKWTAQRLLQATVWDSDFDRLEEMFDSMYYETIKDPALKGKKAIKRVLKCDPGNYQGTPEWKEICAKYPDYIEEFKALVEKYFGNAFLNMPADILGYYCNLDAFYTLQIHEENKGRYTDECRETYLDNQRLGARLHQGGMYKDENFRLLYDSYCSHQIAYGITYAATVRCKMKMEKHKKKANSLKSYSAFAKRLLSRSEFHLGNTVEIAKDILGKNIDTMDSTDTGLDEGKLLLIYGSTFAEGFLDIVKEAMTETKYKGKIDEGIVRKKKILGVIGEKLVPFLGLDKIKLGERHEELEKYLWYEKSYREFLSIWSTQMPDLDHIPDHFVFAGHDYEIDEYCDFIQKTYFMCSSPIESAVITKELTEAYKLETVFLTTIYSSINKLPAGKDFYKNLGIERPEDGYKHFCDEYKVYCQNLDKKGICVWPCGYQQSYPQEIWPIANGFWNDISADDMTTTWDNFDGFTKQSTYFPIVVQEWQEMAKPYSESDFDEPFKFMRKMVLHIMLAKKYQKVKSTYMEGLFQDNDRLELDTPIFVPTRLAEPGEPGAVLKMHPKYEVLKKETKRWSSPYHTIISHSDIKSVINSPSGYLLSYFDISSAEVRTCAYMSKDPVMIGLFETHQDLYIHVAKIYFGEDYWNAQDDAFRALWRKRFKTILLGVMYGMGTKTLAGRLGVEPGEAQELIDTLFGQFKVLKKYIEKNMEYPLQHNGQLDTLMGDTLKSPAWRFVKMPNGKIDHGAMAKVSRHGINYIIQSASAVSLARGFWNNIREAKKAGFVLEPIIVVHDSNTNYFPIEKLFDIKAFYDEHFTAFCENQLHVPFLFDLLVGENYNDAVTLKQIDPETIQLQGNAHSILKILNKITYESSLGVSLNVPLESIVPKYIENPMQRFILEKGTSMVMDKSKYTVELKKQ